MPFTSGKQAFLEILKQEGVEVMFGNKHMLKRATAAVEQSLEPGEQIDVIVYGRDLHFSPEALFVGAGMAGLADTFLLTLTNQRVIVHKGDTMNLSRSRFLGASPRDEVAVTAADPPRSPTPRIPSDRLSRRTSRYMAISTADPINAEALAHARRRHSITWVWQVTALSLLIIGLCFAHLRRQSLGPVGSLLLLVLVSIPFRMGLGTIRPQVSRRSQR